ncbi:MAG: hypothetical protein IPL49_06650 [Saprospirales bacterium]|nr:hypothetical protein [Saprospirales bacterium]MBK8490572.1 hypothetical protein [Saprospirales bacterium]
MRYLIVSLLFAATLLVACRPSSAPQEPAESEPAIDISDFYSFYNRFHLDSAYQMAHIIFPLEGLPPNVDSATLAGGNFHWQPEDWNLHQPVDYETSEFRREIKPVSEELVVEKIIHRSGQAGMLRRFAKIEGEWYLIYFADMNRIKNK